MAENLQFPILFDLEKGVETAIKDWDSKYADKLEKAIQKRALGVKLKFDTKAFDNLDDVKRRLAELKITPLTPENKQAIQELTKELKGLAKLMEKISNFKGIELPELQAAKAAKLRKDVAQADEKLRLSKERIRQAEERLILSQQRAAQQAKNTGKAFGEQESCLSNLTKKMAAYASLCQVGNFLTSVREATAQFELQRVSLGAILQDANKGEQIFSQIKQFALNTPLSILDMTRNTKQLAAYKIEGDELFEMTKRFADISVGLGADYQRIALAAGQTKTATYLRASELKQFTELGVPLLEELSIKLSKVNGEMVSTAEVMDMISKRAISWELVKEALYDMTDAGGMFYNMQEKQSQTLYGMWAKMGDAAAVMYDQIGNTATVNSGMKYLIQLLQDSMLHWTAFANVLQTGVLGFAAYKAAMAGLVPFYKLNCIQIMASIKAEKAQQSLLLRRTSLYTKLTTAQLRQLVSTKKLTTAEWEEYITKNKLNQISALRLARMSKENAALQKALINQKLYTQAQLQQIQAMSKGQYVWATVKSAVMGVGGAIKSVGAMLKTFWPLAAITAVIDLLMDWRQAVEAQEAAVKKVDKQYEEMKVTLMEIENAYNDIKNASKSATENEEEFSKTSYSQKLEQLNNIMKLLSQFGLKNTIDLSVLNYENIDPVIDNWIKKLNEVNELSQKWGRSVAEVANAYEGNIFGWSIFGENLNEDMKDLSRSWTKLTVNTEFNNSLRQLKAIVGELANENKGVYDRISKAVGMDLKLALAQKRRNESEVQYQQRIYKNYQDIESYLQTFRNKGEYGGMLPSLSAADVADRFGDFKSDLDEVMHEVRKTIAAFENEEPMTIRMAIDQQFTLNEWEEWQKELVIQELNKDRLKAGLELIPTLSSSATRAVDEGLKAIITSEFPTLFNENELQSLVSAEGIVEAIKSKLDASTESLEKTVQLQNNLVYGSKGFENSLQRVKKLQGEITEIENMRAELAALEAIEGDKTEEQLLRQSELQAKLAEIDDASINTKRAQIAAIVEANAKYDELIKKQRESAEAEREIAKAALDRVSSMGLSDIGKDVEAQFSGLMVDAVKEITDKNYSTDFLISDEDLKKVRDVGDLYAQWAQNTKAIKDEKEKLVGVGITEATIERERAALEEKRAKIELQLKAVEAEISAEKFKGLETQYATLKLALANASTAGAQKTAQENLNKFLGDTKNAEFAILMLKREGLKTSLQEALVSEAANNQIDAYLKGLDNAEKLWEELGKRYNFRLQETGGNHGGSGEDPWIILMKNRMKFMQDFQKGVEDLSKWMGYTKGLADEQENMLGRGLSLKIDSRQLDGTKEELIKWYEDSIAEIRKKIAQMGGKEWEGLGVQMILAKDTKSRVLKKYQELLADMFKELTDFRTEQMQSEMERKLKALADRISRTKTAKEFYEKIIPTTGDYSLASKVAESIFGQNGSELRKALAEQVRSMAGDIPLPDNVISADNVIEYKALRQFAEANKNELGKMYDELIKISNDGQKDLAKTYEGYLKDLEKAKTYADKRVELARTTAEKIRNINADIAAGNIDEKVGKATIRGLQDREDKEAAKLEYEAFKDTPIYIQMFEDLEHASTTTLEMMKSRLESLSHVWGTALDPTQLKEVQSRMNEIDEQLRNRNPFKTLKSAYLDYKNAVESVSLQGAVANAGAASKEFYERSEMYGADSTQARAAEKELKAREKIVGIARQLTDEQGKQLKGQQALDKAQKIALDNQLNANAALSIAAAEEQAMRDASKYENPDEDPKVIAAHEAVEKAKEEVNLAQRVSEIVQKNAKTSKTLKENLIGAANQVTQFMQIGADVAQAIGDTMEALGANEDDVQYFNDIATALGDITAGFQGIIDSALSLNVGGIISNAIGVIPNMVKGFVGLFTAGKVKRANKEIKRQQELLDQLEYTYGRLEKAADKVFGADFVANMNQQQKVLQAQAAAYQKQYEAELSKGKKADEEKLKEYQEAYRDTLAEIADMQGKFAERMAGTDVTSAARDFAQAWLEAYASFGDTVGAMKEKFNDLIKNMIVESVMAKTVQMALQPMFDHMDEMYKSGKSMTDVLNYAFSQAAYTSQAISDGLEVNAHLLESLGFNVRDLYATSDNLTGISRDIATASEKDINGLAAHMSTVEYYASTVPGMASDVAAIRVLLEGGAARTSAQSDGFSSIDYTPMFSVANQHLQSLPRIEEQLGQIYALLSRTMVAKGGKFGFNSFYNS